VDFDERAFTDATQTFGTTSVDFNPIMRVLAAKNESE